MNRALTAFEEYEAVGSFADRERAVRLNDRFLEVEGSDAKVAALVAVAKQEGLTYSTARRLFYAWRKQGAVALADGRRNRASVAGSDFYADFMRYAANNRNDSKNGYRDMLRDLRAGRRFSFGTWRDRWAIDFPFEPVPPVCPANYIPHGFSYTNMMNRQSKDANAKMSLTWARRGQFAALRYTLPVWRSRVGLHVGEVVQADDVWHNIDVFAKGVQGVFNPLEFAFYDVASAFKVVSAVKPRTYSVGTDGKWKRDNLTEFQFRLAVAFLMCCQGFYKGGITLVGERGTTAIRENVLRRIEAVPGYGKLFKFQTSGVKNEPVARGMFVGNAGGNPRMKSLCECAHNIMHNATAGLLGNHGRDAAHKSESMAAVVRYSEDMLDQARRIDPAIVPLLQLPILDFDTYLTYFRTIEDEVMDRHDVRLEGWEQNFVMEYRLAVEAPWRKVGELADMSPDEATAVSAVLSRDKAHLMRQRKMSRREVWAAGQRDLIRWPLAEMPAFLDPRDMREGRVRDGGYIEFTDATYYAGQTMRYAAWYKDRNGERKVLAPGERVRFYWNPLGTLSRQIWIADADGNSLGMCPMLAKAAWADAASVKAAMGQQMHATAERLRDARAAAAETAAAQLAAKEINRALIEGAKAAKAAAPTFEDVEAADVLALGERGENGENGERDERSDADDFEDGESFLAKMTNTTKEKA